MNFRWSDFLLRRIKTTHYYLNSLSGHIRRSNNHNNHRRQFVLIITRILNTDCVLFARIKSRIMSGKWRTLAGDTHTHTHAMHGSQFWNKPMEKHNLISILIVIQPGLRGNGSVRAESGSQCNTMIAYTWMVCRMFRGIALMSHAQCLPAAQPPESINEKSPLEFSLKPANRKLH